MDEQPVWSIYGLPNPGQANPDGTICWSGANTTYHCRQWTSTAQPGEGTKIRNKIQMIFRLLWVVHLLVPPLVLIWVELQLVLLKVLGKAGAAGIGSATSAGGLIGQLIAAFL